MKYKVSKRTPFVGKPRSKRNDYLDGKLTHREYILLSWLYDSANPYAIAEVTLDDIAKNLFPGKWKISTNRINKLLLSLKRKRYIWYPDRSGRRGSFRIEIGEFLVSKGLWNDISHHWEKPNVRGEEHVENAKVADVLSELEEERQSLDERIAKLYEGFTPFQSDTVRGSDNDISSDNKKSS